MGANCQSFHVFTNLHFNDVTKQWISPECEKNYDNMIKIQAEHCSQPGVVPITPEELSVKVLKPRSGYVKGLGLRHSFSVRTTSASTDSDYVRHLEMEIQEQKEEIQSQKKKIQAQKEEIQAQNKEIGKMNGSIDENFEMTSSIMEFLKKQGFKGQFRGGGIP
ncbi:uncharacterized protein LOC114287937 [Camellia sinensis]|uniref:uncharacterized protein LOC114287937 n=1 Tax=Camellia sinensis TaxID=4442 RepID=UPI0010357E56|nr:uncharacterized protein LOC114287937 [Camellia sinensis]